MSVPRRQSTRFEGFQRQLGSSLLGVLRRSWRHASLGLLALLLGYYLGQNLITLLMVHVPGGRPTLVLAVVLVVELLIRLRGRLLTTEETPLAWRMVDNLRIGLTYALVMEAFKIGT